MTLQSPDSPFQVNMSATDPIVTAANTYLSEAYGNSEDAYFLNVNTAAEQTYAANLGQGFLCTDLLNFTNSPLAIPSINTSQQPATATVGGSIADTATVSGGDSPTGTVTFNLYSNSSGTGPVLFTDTESLSGGTATSAGYTATATGTDYWVATYNGDSNNASVTSGTALEPVTVTPVTPSINTCQQPATATVGTSIADKATVSGGYNPTGTVTFNLYSNSSGTGTPLFTDANESLSGGTATSAGYTATATGTDYWVATYNGDSNNASVTSATTAEPVTIGKASPTIGTTPSTTSSPCSSTLTLKDTATLSGGDDPTGTITFTLYNPNSTLVDTETVTVSGDGSYTTPKGYTLPTRGTVTGTYQWDATYNGDPNNNTASDINDSKEQVVIGKASPSISTTPSTSNTQCSSTLTLKDTATLSGGDDPTGTITFTLYNPNSTLVDTETVTVSGDGSYTTPKGYTLPTTGTVTGTYQWDATYNGDPNNNTASDINDSKEQVVIGKAGMTISTTPSQSIVSKGTATCVTDTAMLSGGDNPTGSITFTLYSPSGTKLDTETVTVKGDGSYTTPKGYSLSSTAAAGVYQWDATYSGDNNNSAVSDNNDPAEQVTVITPCCNLQNISYSLTPLVGKTTTATVLRGSTQQGETVSVTFTVPSGDYDQLSLVSYVAPQSYFSASSAYLQQVYNNQSVTQVFGPGTHTLGPVTIPSSYYQIDFVCGTVICQLGLSPNDFYSAQSRLIDADNGGTTLPACMAGSTVGAGQTAAPSFWTNTAAGKGQALIDSLNGGSSSTNLGNWLATVSPNLLGSLQGETNTQIASYVKSLSSSSANLQVLATALAAYVTDSSLAGTVATSYGFTVTAFGTGVDIYNVGSNGSALGLSNNESYSIVTLLAAIDAESSNGVIGGKSATNAANTVFTAINTAGKIS